MKKLLDEKNKVKRFSSAQKMQELGDSLILQGNYSTAWVRYSAGYFNHPSALLFFKAAEAMMYNTLLHTKYPGALFKSLLGCETGFYFSR